MTRLLVNRSPCPVRPVTTICTGLKAARPGRSRRRYGAHTHAPATAAPTPVGWRERQRVTGRFRRTAVTSVQLASQWSRIWQPSGAGVLPNLVLSGSARTCQERLGRRLSRSSTLDRTCPKRSRTAVMISEQFSFDRRIFGNRPNIPM
jgi:hypothetical protein